MWLIWVCLFSSLVAVFLSVWCFLSLPKKLEITDISGALEKASEDTARTVERRIKAIEIEWDDMYQKFSKLAGRVDRQRQLDTAKAPPAEEPVKVRTRSDILRRGRAASNE